MRRKSPKILLQIVLLGALLGSASNAYADAMSSITFNNFSISTSANNPISFVPWIGFVSGMANFEGASVNQNTSTVGGAVQLFATTPFVPNGGTSFARGAGLVDAANVTGTALAQAHPNGCTCSGSGVGQFALSNLFTVTGGTGTVDVTIAFALSTVQTLALDEFDLMGTAVYMFDIEVDGMSIFSVDNSVSSSTPNSFTEIRSSQTVFRIITLQLGTPHTITISGIARASASSEIPEPATLFLLGSGLALIAGLVRKRRRRVSRP